MKAESNKAIKTEVKKYNSNNEVKIYAEIYHPLGRGRLFMLQKTEGKERNIGRESNEIIMNDYYYRTILVFDNKREVLDNLISMNREFS